MISLLYVVADKDKLDSLENRLAEAETQFNSANLDQQLENLKYAKEEQVTVTELIFKINYTMQGPYSTQIK